MCLLINNTNGQLEKVLNTRPETIDYAYLFEDKVTNFWYWQILAVQYPKKGKYYNSRVVVGINTSALIKLFELLNDPTILLLETNKRIEQFLTEEQLGLLKEVSPAYDNQEIKQAIIIRSMEIFSETAKAVKTKYEYNYDESVMALLRELDLGPNETEWLKNQLRQSHKDESDFREKAITALINNLKQVQNRKTKIYYDKLDGIIDEETYLSMRNDFIIEEADLMTQIKRHSVANQKYIDFGCLVIDVAHRAAEIYEVRKSEEKRYLSNKVFSNLSLRNKNVTFSLRLIFKAILEYKKTKNWLGD